MEHQKSMGLLSTLGQNTAFGLADKWFYRTRYKLKSSSSAHPPRVCRDPHPTWPGQYNGLFLECSGWGWVNPTELWMLRVGASCSKPQLQSTGRQNYTRTDLWRSHRSKYCLGSEPLLESLNFVESCRSRGNTSPPPASVYSRVMPFMTASLYPEYLFYCPCREIFPFGKNHQMVSVMLTTAH